jgi:hypothetical protein
LFLSLLPLSLLPLEQRTTVLTELPGAR